MTLSEFQDAVDAQQSVIDAALALVEARWSIYQAGGTQTRLDALCDALGILRDAYNDAAAIVTDAMTDLGCNSARPMVGGCAGCKEPSTGKKRK